jgi:3',5'-cyclic-AMP phosphodiesterase
MRIVQITDPHVTAADPGPDGYHSAAAFEAVLQRAAALDPAPDLVVLTGDLADNGTPAEYGRVRAILAGCRLPLAAIPGNHDRRAGFVAALDGTVATGTLPFLNFSLDLGPLRVIGLDTVGVEGGAAGLLCEDRLSWVADRLGEDDRPVLLFMHHPPFRIGQRIADESRCRNGESLAAIIARDRRVRLVGCGHAHLPAQVAWAGTQGSVCPAVAWEVPFDHPPGAPFRLRPRAPAFQLHAWSAAGGLVSHVIRLEGGAAAGAGAPEIPGDRVVAGG